LEKLPDPKQLVSQMAQDLTVYLAKRDFTEPLYIGIHTGGVWLARHLLGELNYNGQLGELNVSFYRDDFTYKGLHPQVRPSALPFAIDGRNLVLIDDILLTGRTVRAALNELFDYGRPASVTFVCLIDLNSRELPIRPDVVGAELNLPRNMRVKMTDEPFALELLQITEK